VCKNLLAKLSPRFFLSQGGILLIDCLPKGQTIIAEYYSSVLVQLNNILKEKGRGKFTKVSCSCTTMLQLIRHFATQKKMAYLAFQYVDRPSYSPDLAPSV